MLMIDKKTGAIHFETADGTVRVKGTFRGTAPDYGISRPGNFLTGSSSEKINAKGILSTDLLVLRCQGKVYFFWRKADADATCFIGERIRNRCRCDTIRSCFVISKPMVLISVRWATDQIDYYFIYGGDE